MDDNSMVDEHTFTAELPSTAAESPETMGRKSMSQPALPSSRAAASASSLAQGGKSPVARNIPIIQTWHENEELRGKLFTLSSDVQMYEQRYNMAKETMHIKVQDVLDEYITLKLNKDQVDEDAKQFHEMKQELIMIREQLSDAEKRIRDSEASYRRNEEIFNKRVLELEDLLRRPQPSSSAERFSLNNTTIGSLRAAGCLDDMKGNDTNWTFSNADDKLRMDLENKLYDALGNVAALEQQVEKLKEELDDKSARLADVNNRMVLEQAANGGGLIDQSNNESKTFVFGGACTTQTHGEQAQYIDDLEKQLKEAGRHQEKVTAVLGEYMNRVSRLEKELRDSRKTSFDASSVLLDGRSTADELKEQIARVNAELNELRSENRDLRVRCAQLNGADGDVSNSLGQSRLLAGLSSGGRRGRVSSTSSHDVNMHEVSLSQAYATGARSSGSPTSINENVGQRTDDAENRSEISSLIELDASAARRLDAEDDAMFDEMMRDFNEMNARRGLDDTSDETSDDLMPPPNRLSTVSFLRSKSRGSARNSSGGVGGEGNASSHSNDPNLPRDSEASAASSGMTGVTTIDTTTHPRRSETFTITVAPEEETRSVQATPPRRSNVFDSPMMHDFQEILTTSAALIQGSHNATLDLAAQQEKMSTIRSALTRLFNRLKSSAALFEEILEKMGTSSVLADRIQQMRLAFETSMHESMNVSQFIEAAERDLTNMSLNFSVLEKSMNQSLVLDVSRRFSIAPPAEDIFSSSLLNASYQAHHAMFSPSAIHSRDSIVATSSALCDAMRREIEQLKQQLEEEKAKSENIPDEMKTSTLMRQLTDAQIRASQNFEEFEMCQASLMRLETEKMKSDKALKELSTLYSSVEERCVERENELKQVMETVIEERKLRRQAEAAVEATSERIQKISKDSEERERIAFEDLEQRINAESAMSDELKRELKEALESEAELREQNEILHNEVASIKRRTREAETKVEDGEKYANELMQSIASMSVEMERLRQFEQENIDVELRKQAGCGQNKSMFSRSVQTDKDAEIESTPNETTESLRRRLFEAQDAEREAVEGVEKVRKELTKLTRKPHKVAIVAGNVSSIRVACDEMCRHLARETNRQKELATELERANDKLEKSSISLKSQRSMIVDGGAGAVQVQGKALGVSNRENILPTGSGVVELDKSSSADKFRDPTRQLLRDATCAVDAIVQKLKATQNMQGMDGELKDSVVRVLTESRVLRDYLHQKVMVLKTIDLEVAGTETNDQLLQRLEKSYNDFAIVDEECRKLRSELKKMRSMIPQLGNEFETKIKREMGGIARDMGEVRAVRKMSK